VASFGDSTLLIWTGSSFLPKFLGPWDTARLLLQTSAELDHG
jgi:hypothetical protein